MIWGMDLRLTTSYNATPEEVFAIITDVTFQSQVCERTHAALYSVSVDTADGDTLVRIRREVPEADVPELVRRAIGGNLVMMQTRRWHPAERDGARDAEIEGQFDGVPIQLSGRSRIVPEGESTIESIELTVTSSVPVIGQRLERVAFDTVALGLNTKFELAWSWLAGSL